MLVQGEGRSDPLGVAHALQFSGEPEGDRLSPAGLREEWGDEDQEKERQRPWGAKRRASGRGQPPPGLSQGTEGAGTD